MHSAIVSSSLLTLAALLPISGAAPFAVNSAHDGVVIEDGPLEVAGTRATGLPHVPYDHERDSEASSGRTAKRKDVQGFPKIIRPLHMVSTIPVFDEPDKLSGSDSTRTKSSASTQTAASASKERRKLKLSSSSSSSGEEEEGSSSLGTEIWDGVKDIGKNILKGTAVTAGTSLLGDIAANEAQSSSASASATATAAAAAKERRKIKTSSSSSSGEEEEGSSSLGKDIWDAAKDFGKNTLISGGSTVMGSELASEVKKHWPSSTTTTAAQQQRRVISFSPAEESRVANALKSGGPGPILAEYTTDKSDVHEIARRSVAASLGKATGKKATHEIIKDEKSKNKTRPIDDDVKTDLEELKAKITDLLSELEDMDKHKDSSSKMRTRATAEDWEDIWEAGSTLRNKAVDLTPVPVEKRSPGLSKDLFKGAEGVYDIYEDWKDEQNQKRSPKLGSLLKGGEKALEAVEDGYDMYETVKDNSDNDN